jgi:acyl-CoA synthetase (AMP-forming)/AMP-acid ligase II
MLTPERTIATIAMSLSTGKPELFRAPLDIPEVPYDHLLRKVAVGITVVQDYGLTESSPDTHVTPLEPALARPGSVGLLVHNKELMI